MIRIEGMIYDFTVKSVRRRVERARDAGASTLVFAFDTPGGKVQSALALARFLRGLEIPTVAWVRAEAYSAGILIASACDRLVMAPASATGDCAPIVPGKSLAPTERAKALSPILEAFRANAEDNGYDYAAFHAMCVLGVELYLIEHPETGERRLVNQLDYRYMVRGVAKDRAPGVLERLFGRDETVPDDVSPVDVGAPTRTASSEADKGAWRPVTELPNGPLPAGRVHNGNTLFTVGASRAEAIGLSEATVADRAALRRHLGATSVRSVSQTWSEDLAGWLTHPAVRAVLVLVLLLGAYTEFQAPGLGFPGAAAAVALAALLGAPFLVGLAEIWHVLVFFVGFLLLAADLLFLVGFGLAGILGLVLMFVGLVLSVVPTSGSGPFPLPPPEAADAVQRSLLAVFAGLVASAFAIYFFTKYFDRSPLGRRLVLASAQKGTVAPATSPTSAVSGDDAFAEGRVREGDEGRALTVLRPSGRAELDGRAVDVVTVGPWIEAGSPVRVVEVRGNRVVVEEAAD